MRTAKVPTEKLREIRDYLSKTAAFEKRAEELERENDVLHRTLGLVASGALDPAVALEKISEYLEDPDTLRIQELAAHQRAGGEKLGSVVDDDITAASEAETPEERYSDAVSDIAMGTGLSVF